ncbi:hypothetical protein [Streptomyces sp. NPDC058086]|uniref:hypothetical protein n=1 Tax=Streptomyces sp. NPDC058086 TaxID=3346334 RepID=UPI0036E237B5
MAWMILVVCTLAGATALTWIEFKLRRQLDNDRQKVRVDRLLWLDRLSVTIQISPCWLASSICCRNCWWKTLSREGAVVVRAGGSQAAVGPGLFWSAAVVEFRFDPVPVG